MQKAGLTLIRVFIGLFFVGEAFNKRYWLADPSVLSGIFGRWLADADAGSVLLSKWYLENVAIPGTHVFAYLVPVGELSVGIALIAGVGMPFVAILAFFMTLNYNVASGALFRETILTNGNVIPMLGTTLGLAVSAMQDRSLLGVFGMGLIKKG